MEKLVYALSHTEDLTPEEMSHFCIRTVSDPEFDASETIEEICDDQEAEETFRDISVSWVRKLAGMRKAHMTDERNEYSAETAEAVSPYLNGIKADRYGKSAAEQMAYEPRYQQQRFSELVFRYLEKRDGKRFPDDRDRTWYQMPEV